MNPLTHLCDTCRLRLFPVVAVILLPVFPVRADLLELVNGDHYLGTVVSMTPSNLMFQSEIQGLVKLPRSKVAKITLHESAPPKQAAITAVPSFAPLALPAATAQPPTTTTNQADAVIQQMRQQGIDPKMIGQVQEQILGKSSPEATAQFNDMVNGLMSGRLSVQNIRAQAQSSIKSIQTARKELGGDAGEMLDGYLAILEKFVQETDTPSGSVPQPQPAP